MKSVDLRNESVDLPRLFHMAEGGAVLVVTPDGHEFILAEADDFEAELETLRQSASFQAFLDRRTVEKTRIPVEDIEKDIAQKLERS